MESGVRISWPRKQSNDRTIYDLNIYLMEICSGSEVGSYFRPIDFVHHSTLGLRVVKEKKKTKIRNGYVRANAMHGEGNRVLNPTAGAVNYWRIIRDRI